MAEILLLAGLGYGDEGKGSITDFLASEKTSLVVRYNGGGNAAHNVVHREYGHHTFSQFGAGTFQGAKTLLSRFMMVNPISLRNEWHALNQKLPRKMLISELLAIENEALVTTDYHMMANRLRERTLKHGSCGMGIGETQRYAVEFPEDAIRIQDVKDKKVFHKKLRRLQERFLAEAELSQWSYLGIDNGKAKIELQRLHRPVEEVSLDIREALSTASFVDRDWLATQVESTPRIIFEGAQGVLLDENHGTHPHTTWSTTTFANAYKLLEDVTHGGDVRRLGILRAYATRHGNGPFVTEDKQLDSLSAHDHNKHHDWQGAFRSGVLDLVSVRYAIDTLGGVDGIALTNIDRLDFFPKAVPICDVYRLPNGNMYRFKNCSTLEEQAEQTATLATVRGDYFYVYVSKGREFLDAVSVETLTPIEIVSYGPSAEDKRRGIDKPDPRT